MIALFFSDMIPLKEISSLSWSQLHNKIVTYLINLVYYSNVYIVACQTHPVLAK